MQNLACKSFCIFFLFYRNANDSEMKRSGIELPFAFALIAYSLSKTNHEEVRSTFEWGIRAIRV